MRFCSWCFAADILSENGTFPESSQQVIQMHYESEGQDFGGEYIREAGFNDILLLWAGRWSRSLEGCVVLVKNCPCLFARRGWNQHMNFWSINCSIAACQLPFLKATIVGAFKTNLCHSKNLLWKVCFVSNTSLHNLQKVTDMCICVHFLCCTVERVFLCMVFGAPYAFIIEKCEHFMNILRVLRLICNSSLYHN